MDICDFHAHILPVADHGSYSVEESLRQLALANKFGVTRVIATSHFYPHKEDVDDFLKRRNRSYAKLNESLNSDYPKVKLGAEVLLFPEIGKLPMLNELCVQGTKTLLLELPFNDFGREYVYAVEGLVADGYNVVLAHAEYYAREHIESLLDIGALLQLNASALVSIFKDKLIESWKSRNKIVAIGSDIHRRDNRAYKNFALARNRLGKYIHVVKEFTDSVWDSAI